MNITYSKYRYSWLFLYLLINIIAYFIIINTGQYLGDVKNHSLGESHYLIYALFTVLTSYFLILFLIFEFIKKIKVKTLNLDTNIQFIDFFGYIILFLLSFYFYFLVSNGIRAGFTGTISSPIKYIWILIPIEYIFFIYYVLCKEWNKIKFINLILVIISSLYKGFGGILFFLLFIEVQNYLIKRGLKKRFVIFIFLFILIFPLLHVIKASSRISNQDIDFLILISTVFFDLNLDNLLGYISFTITYLVERIQIISITAEVIKTINEIRDGVDTGIITPFWLEGLHGTIINKLLNIESFNIGTFIPTTSSFNSTREIGSWNTNPGVLIWFWIYPLYGLFLFAYILVLIFCLIFLSKKISYNNGLLNLAWVGTLSFLLPPWISSFISFILAFFFTYIIFIFFKIFQRKKYAI